MIWYFLPGFVAGVGVAYLSEYAQRHPGEIDRAINELRRSEMDAKLNQYTSPVKRELTEAEKIRREHELSLQEPYIRESIEESVYNVAGTHPVPMILDGEEVHVRIHKVKKKVKEPGGTTIPSTKRPLSEALSPKTKGVDNSAVWAKAQN